MGLFSKGICPICEKNTTALTKSSIKYVDDYVCCECVKKLGENGIMALSIKKKSIEELKHVVNSITRSKNILECPNCGGHNLELLANDKNYKTKYKTTINMNPLKVFTLTNTKEVKKETSNKHNEYFCKDCGNRWIGE